MSKVDTWDSNFITGLDSNGNFSVVQLGNADVPIVTQHMNMDGQVHSTVSNTVADSQLAVEIAENIHGQSVKTQVG